MSTIKHVLAIAGSDPSGGAGIQADIKAISANGAYAMAAITALTAQNTRGVRGVQLVAPEFVTAQIDAVFEDIRVDAVKIGMLGSPEITLTVAEALARHGAQRIVLDPVMVAKGGDRLLSEAAIRTLIERLLPLATILTPNLPEAAALLDEPELTDPAAMPALAERLLALGPSAVLLKGGHLSGAVSPDYLAAVDEGVWLEAERIPTKNTHGTGCTLSSALAAQLAIGADSSLDLATAARRAKVYVAGAIAHADALDVGQGQGPTHHFHALWPAGYAPS
ncbi:MAG: bifunctional hydroxymethylpyrimidine kinase/phosphomethylpyrimidine kinase [Lamprobacter sp.]|uniref:bifunctional hydroxymethylpyrimidine kinase/phosphomethylpyrimidine kinase n=1 Tax=Lamprobacter sp. TaxID=3100796 RepID=UPI002B257B27|nr:bifunctional hydroxymethylpyrimidine kinase/phosphomethylpyrimidine kinase [Lamprobacter sp.]MEA3641057.1 bifunctional hydroxymethylpyrimidine kinase/phosphomethylpyrimidine kinase [Lamprobacter sp.]